MAQISRPFQIALAGVLLLALVWTFALHSHSSSPSEPVPASSPAPRALSTSAKHAKVAASEGKSTVRVSPAHRHAMAGHKTVGVRRTVVHAPHKTTVLTRKVVVDRSHGVSAIHAHRVSVTHTHKLSVTHGKTVTTKHEKVPVSHKPAVAPVTHAVTHPATTPSSRSGSSTAKHQPPAGQLAVEHELAQGKTVMLVFWNPHTAVDQEVRSQASALASGSKGTVVMHSALASQVNTFGSITEVVRVYQTPTILIVNRHGVVSTLTGLTEVFALRQAVSEAQHAGH